MKDIAVKNAKTTSLKKAPKQERSRAMVEKLLGAARTVLLEEGAEGLTTNHIAKQAGISVGSLYQYFPNKQSIIAELFRQWLAGTGEGFEAEILQVAQSDKKIDTLMQ